MFQEFFELFPRHDLCIFRGVLIRRKRLIADTFEQEFNKNAIDRNLRY